MLPHNNFQPNKTTPYEKSLPKPYTSVPKIIRLLTVYWKNALFVV